MIHILKMIAVLIAITYSLRLINAQSDLLVFGGLAVAGSALFYLVQQFSEIFKLFKSKL